MSNLNNTKSPFSDRLMRAMNRINIPKKHLAEKCNISPSSISNYLSGCREPSLETLILLSNELGVSSDYLLGKVDNFEDISEHSNILDYERKKKSVDDTIRVLKLLSYY